MSFNWRKLVGGSRKPIGGPVGNKFVFPIEIFLEPERFIGLDSQQRRDAVEEFINRHPEKHNQNRYLVVPGMKFKRPDSSFDCGTTACIAGWAIIFAGHSPTEADMEFQGVLPTEITVEGHEGRVTVHQLAQEVLGLDKFQADALFGGQNSRQDLKEIFQALRDGWEGGDYYCYWVHEQRERREAIEKAENRHP